MSVTGLSNELPADAPGDPHRSVRRWLWFMWGAVLAMVVVGGITRLTGSGLSMVEWRPLMGVLPPLSEAEWLDVFTKYQGSPQYQTVNHWMTLEDFKSIFFWEYLHRLLGRLIGLFFFIPFVWYLARGHLRGRIARRTFVAFLLGGAQGLLGWYMVKSGLVDRPEVSHYRLAAHLSLAFFVGMYVLWLAWDLAPRAPLRDVARPRPRWAWAVIALLGVQILWGAFMAGTRAGHLAPTFPDMNGDFVPDGMLASDASWIVDLMDNPWSIHFVHRILGWLVLGAGIALSVHLLKRSSQGAVGRAGKLLAAAVTLQFLLGVLTVLLHVATWIAVMHQAGAYLLLTAATWAAWLSAARDGLPPRSPPEASGGASSPTKRATPG